MDQRQLPEDFKDFINLLNGNDVCYLLVGGWAVGIYGYPRATKDIDFLIANDGGNLIKLQKALLDFGTPEIKNNNPFFVKPHIVGWIENIIIIARHYLILSRLNSLLILF